jgi:ribosome-binding ATPase YchF (GTP1/OBG family)
MIIGVVGKPNSGKSSFFKAATMIDVKISSIPFTTIEPNVGVGYATVDCVCKDFKVNCRPKHGYCKNGKRFVPVKLIDVAGLVPGAHEGKGMGNQFLDDLRQASVLIHVVDATGETDAEGKSTSGHDPLEDVKFLEEEIDLWFASVIERAIAKYKRQIEHAGRSELANILSESLSGLEISRQQIELALESADVKDVKKFAKEVRRVSKPIIVAANKIDLKAAQENFKKIQDSVGNAVAVSAQAEIALKKAAESGAIDYVPGDSFEIKSELNEQQKKALEFLKSEIIDKYGSTGVQQVMNDAVFKVLGYIAVYPVADRNKLSDKDGNVLPDVFLVPKGTTVKELAFKVHTDLGDKFICGVDARTKMRLSADHELKNGDVVEIMFAK